MARNPVSRALRAVHEIRHLAGLREVLEAVRLSAAALKETEKGFQPPDGVSGRQQRTNGSHVVRLVRCGKKGCSCSKPGGNLHGPYLYRMTYVSPGKYRKTYLGRADAGDKKVGNDR